VTAAVQAAMVAAGGVQCGFCTPGFVVSLTDLLHRNPDPDEFELREALSGNLCRCTGYVRIFEAAQSAAASLRGAR
jgi:carbon-monoxide dehydrogenase small subunit